MTTTVGVVAYGHDSCLRTIGRIGHALELVSKVNLCERAARVGFQKLDIACWKNSHTMHPIRGWIISDHTIWYKRQMIELLPRENVVDADIGDATHHEKMTSIRGEPHSVHVYITVPVHWLMHLVNY